MFLIRTEKILKLHLKNFWHYQKTSYSCLSTSQYWIKLCDSLALTSRNCVGLISFFEMKIMVKTWYCEQKYYVWIQQKYWSRLSLLLQFFSERQCCWVCKRRNRLHSERNGGWKDRTMKDNRTVFLMLLVLWTITGGYFKFSSNDG